LSILNPLFDAVAWVMMRIHAVLAVPFGASSGVTWALSIIILVVLMRLVMVPLFIKQRNSMWKMQSHMPQLQEIRKKYKNDKTRLNEETMKFYKENGINPLGGCLPLVAQLPVFWSLFNVLKAIAQWTPPAAGQPAVPPKYGMTIPFVESAHNARIFGISLYDQFLHPAAGESLTSRLLIVVFVLVSAATTFLTMRQSQRRGMMNQTAPDPDAPGAAAAASMSKNMMYIAPFFALTGLYWQFGLVLYWVTTNVWTLGQQHFLFRKLPVVGSATVASSAAPATGSSGGASRPAAAKTAAAKSGSSSTSSAAGKPGAKAGAPRPAAARTNGPKPAQAKSQAKPAGTKPAGVKPAGTKPAAATAAADATVSDSTAATSTAATSAAPAAAAAKVNGSKRTPGKSTASSGTASNGTTGNGPAANGASGNGTGGNTTSSGPSVLRRFSRSKEEPQDDVPAAPQTRVVRQQPVRQARSKRGNTGKG
jgi:YidC/Oxa1 family membrane protein insertase